MWSIMRPENILQSGDLLRRDGLNAVVAPSGQSLQRQFKPVFSILYKTMSFCHSGICLQEIEKVNMLSQTHNNFNLERKNPRISVGEHAQYMHIKLVEQYMVSYKS